jgi:hypothetical protein
MNFVIKKIGNTFALLFTVLSFLRGPFEGRFPEVVLRFNPPPPPPPPCGLSLGSSAYSK